MKGRAEELCRFTGGGPLDGKELWVDSRRDVYQANDWSAVREQLAYADQHAPANTTLPIVTYVRRGRNLFSLE